MKHTEKFISPLVAAQFPQVYREEGPMFVAFVKSYYEWLESANNVLYHSRRFPEYRDIDTTIEDFIVYFKEKYLKNIQFETSSNKRLFIKNAIPFYRSKGTERSVDLFFKLIYGVPAKVYYPGDDLFKLSSGEWTVPIYLEVTPSSVSLDFIGKEITGVTSGAIAFVEDLVVKKIKSKYVHVLYISNLQGNFQFDEIIKLNDDAVDLTEYPRTIGSVGKIEIVDGGVGFTVGQTVNFVSANGAFAKAVVTGIQNIEGEVTFELLDGGFGYNSESSVLISNNVLTISGITSNEYVVFETVSQSLSRIDFDTSDGQFVLNTSVFRYDANGDVTGEGIIINKNQIANSGNLVVTTTTGDLTSGVSTLYNTGNTISANIVQIVNVTATGNVIGISSNLTLIAADRTGSYDIGESIYQSNGSTSEWANGIIKSFDVSGDDVVIRITNATGEFIAGELVKGRTSNVQSNLQSYSTKIGVVSVNNTFYSTDPTVNNNKIIGSESSTEGVITAVSTGNGAGFMLGSNTTMDNIEVLPLNTDFIESHRHALLEFDNSDGDFTVGETIRRYYVNNALASEAVVLDVTQTPSNPNGFILIYTVTGNTPGFAPNAAVTLTNTFYTVSNTITADVLDFTPNTAYYTLIAIEADEFGFPADPMGNLTSNTIDNILSFENYTIGTLTTLTSINPGNSYNKSPYVKILEPAIYQYGYKDYSINYSSPTSTFRIGEIVKQANSIGQVELNGAIGQVLSTNTSVLIVRRLLIANSFSTGKILGTTSGAVASVEQVNVYESEVTGFNALIDADTTTLGGSVTSLQPVASGFGYQNQEIVTFYLSEDESIEGTAKLTLNKEGMAEGFYNENGGFLSSNKYVYDGHYYQEYSYDVFVGLPFDKYSDMFKKVLHVAGTKAYGTFDSSTKVDTLVANPESSISYLSNVAYGYVSGNTSSANLVGTDTEFEVMFSVGDYISVYNSNFAFVYDTKKIAQIVDNTHLIMSGPLSFTNSHSTYYKLNDGSDEDYNGDVVIEYDFSSLPANTTLTRASTAWYIDDAGILQQAATNVPRFTANGLLVEAASTNFIRNSTMVGGSVGVLPNNWGNNGTSGTTLTILGIGTENGSNYLDLRYSGTPSSTQTRLGLESITGLPALTGQDWNLSASIKIVAGDLTNISSIAWLIQERNSIGTSLVTKTGSNFKTNLGANYYRASFSTVLSGGGTVAFAIPELALGLSIGQAIDITLRITMPQMERGTVATSFIKTTSAAVTRAADILTLSTKNGSYDIDIDRVSGTTALVGTIVTANTYTVPTNVSPILDIITTRIDNEIENISFMNVVLPYKTSLSRASTGWYFDNAGVLQSASTNVPRYNYNPNTLAYEGLLTEPARTNGIRNNTMVGAVAGSPGTLPTNWRSSNFAESGMTYTIVGAGSDNGINYIELKVSGTVAVAGFYDLVRYDVAGAIAAANSQVWNQSIYLKLVGGSLSGLNGGGPRLGLYAYNGGGAFITTIAGSYYQPSSSWQRATGSFTLSDATVASIIPIITINVTIGAIIDFTVRVGLPQLEQGSGASSPIKTTSAAVTRAADVLTMTLPNGTYNFDITNLSGVTNVTNEVVSGETYAVPTSLSPLQTIKTRKL